MSGIHHSFHIPDILPLPNALFRFFVEQACLNSRTPMLVHSEYSQLEYKVSLLNLQFIACGNIPGRFNPIAVEVDLATVDSFGGD